MTHEIFLATQRERAGSLGAYVEEFGALLASTGYARATIREHVRLLADLGRWLERHQLPVGDFDSVRGEQFLRSRRRRGRATRSNSASLFGVLGMLRGIGVVRPAICAAPCDAIPVTRLERAFAEHLVQERGLSAATRTNYVPIARRLLMLRFGGGPVDLAELRAEDVTAFVLREVRSVSPGRAKLMVSALRSFLRWLCARGDTATDLSGAVPRVANWRLATLPKSIQAEQVEQLLRHCERATPVGLRDYAILLLLARLGLRAGEVVAMELDDLDWGAGEFVVRGKGGRHDRLPLPHDVGSAVAAYLRCGRPACSTRRVFVRAKAPLRGFANSIAICTIVERALARAGLNPPRKGAHLLRHTLACTMLRQGASLDEIGQILRHRNLDTTAIYAKVDLVALRGLAPSWPRSAGAA